MTLQQVISDEQVAALIRARDEKQWWRRYDDFIVKLLASQIGPATLTREDGHPVVLCEHKAGVSRVWLRRLAMKRGVVRSVTIRMTDKRFSMPMFAEFGNMVEGFGANYQLCLICNKNGPLHVYDWALFDMHLVRQWVYGAGAVPHLIRINPVDGNEFLDIPASMLPAEAYKLNADTFRIT